jgi:hypothetical protein
MRQRYAYAGIVLALFLIMVTEVVLSTRQQSPSWDEGNHIYSGYMNWKQGLYSLNPEHPPLVKLVATLPLLPLDLKVAPRQGSYFKLEAYLGGRELLFRNSPQNGGKYGVDTLLFRVHMGALVFGLTLGILIFVAGREMFGATAALIALALFVFDPSILAHAPYVTTDTGAACGFFAAVYTFYRFSKSMSWQRALICGAVTGLALTAKHSAIVLAPLFVLLACVEIVLRWREGKQFPSRDLGRILPGMGVIAAVALFVMWGVYSFRFPMQTAGFTMPSMPNAVASLSGPMKSFILFCANYHLLPESYLYGLADVQSVGNSWPMYFFGKIYTNGLWYYFPVVLSLKWTVGTLGIVALSLYAILSGKIGHLREVLYLAVPLIFILGIAMAGPLNMGVRHILPIFPFTFMLCGAAAAWLVKQRKAWACAVGVLLLLHATESLRAYPQYLSFGNDLYGGPSKTDRYFSDSASDWGQQLKWVKLWVDRNHVKECSFAYYVAPFILPADYGIPCKLLPTFDDPAETTPVMVRGPVLVSLGDLNGYEFGTKVRNPYQSLFERKPDDVIANGVAVFYGDVALPQAAAFGFVRQARDQLESNPKAALAAAHTAVQINPNGFDENLALGAALAATGDKTGARAAFQTALRRIADMEPGAQAEWKPKIEKQMAEVQSAPSH